MTTPIRRPISLRAPAAAALVALAVIAVAWTKADDEATHAAVATSARDAAIADAPFNARADGSGLGVDRHAMQAGQVRQGAGARPVLSAISPTNDASADQTIPRDAHGAVLMPPGVPSPQVSARLTPVTPPSMIDADGQGSSAVLPPARIPAVALSTRGAPSLASSSDMDGLRFTAAADSGPVVVYTPAQIQLAYGYSTLPVGNPSNMGIYQGSGQVIVVIAAFHYAAVADDLNRFSRQFGLPICTVDASPTVTRAKPGDGCSIQVVYADRSGAQTATTPVVNDGWNAEAALDVQWAHAIAPLAKIVLIEAPTNNWADTSGAIQFAAKLAGISAVSMSFGVPEWSSAPSYGAMMTGSATWVASAGDNGRQVNFPASSKNVLAVGGTYLGNVSPRAESAWAGSGGGLSAYETMPTWQSTVTIPGNAAVASGATRIKPKRGVPDVAYNASGNSAVYVMHNGAWYGASGTSAGAPQWAATVALINAVRGSLGKAPFSGTGFQKALYGMSAGSNYIVNFMDVTSGSNGVAPCTTCTASTGYDLVTGLGTPNASALIRNLSMVN